MSVVITDMSELNGSIYFLLNVWLVSYEGVIRMEEWVGLCDHITHYIPSTVPVFSMHCSSLRVRSHAQRLLVQCSQRGNISLLEVGMTGRMKRVWRLQLFLIRYPTNLCIFSHYLLFVFRHVRPAVLGLCSYHEPRGPGGRRVPDPSALPYSLLITHVLPSSRSFLLSFAWAAPTPHLF